MSVLGGSLQERLAYDKCAYGRMKSARDPLSGIIEPESCGLLFLRAHSLPIL